MFLFAPFLSADSDALLASLNLPTHSKAWIPIDSPKSEINESLILRAVEAFRYPLNPNRQLIISMRWTTLEEQISHFVFGAALAFALNRTIKIEMRRYPLSGPQPPFLFDFRDLVPARVDPLNFTRIRISREFYCKSAEDFETAAPIVVRNFDDISALYGNHFIGEKLRELFGFHAGFFLAHRFVNLSGYWKIARRRRVGIEAKSFMGSRRMEHLKDGRLIASKFISAVHQIANPAKYQIVVVTNDTTIAKEIRRNQTTVKVMGEDCAGLARLIEAEKFIGTFRSKLSVHVNAMRAVPGWLLDTDTGKLLKMSNSQAGVLSPYVQDVEDSEFTLNERLRGCTDNIDDLRDVLQTFVL
jgi:hypothetical protein